MDKRQNMESIYTIWNYLIKKVPNTISGNRVELVKLNNEIKQNESFKFWSLSKTRPTPIVMSNGLSNQWGKKFLQRFISRKSSRFELKLGELVNLTFLFCVDELGFSCLNDACYGKKKKSIFAVTTKTNKK